MARYIDAGVLIGKLVAQKHFYPAIVARAIEDTPEADVAEVKHGEWIRHSPDVAKMRAFHELGIGKGMSEKSIFWTCSCCGSWGTLTQKYCSECGAKMDGGKKG